MVLNYILVGCPCEVSVLCAVNSERNVNIIFYRISGFTLENYAKELRCPKKITPKGLIEMSVVVKNQ